MQGREAGRRRKMRERKTEEWGRWKTRRGTGGGRRQDKEKTRKKGEWKTERKEKSGRNTRGGARIQDVRAAVGGRLQVSSTRSCPAF